jgi:hypothetical protein
MKKQIGNIKRFSFAEMTSNNDGKTSASGTMGVLICVIGTFCFLVGCLDKIFVSKDIDIITQSIIFVGIGASLLGLRKYKASDFVPFEANNTPTPTVTTPPTNPPVDPPMMLNS